MVSNSLKAMQDYTYISRYALYNKDKKRRETWEESCDRGLEMHLSKFPQISEELKWAFSKVKLKKVLGSQRALQFAGQPILRHNARQYNCTSSYVDRPRFFQECMYLLLCGCGTGFSVQKHHIDKLPYFNLSPRIEESEYTIQDSIEGWADSIGILISSYLKNPIFPEYHNAKIKFNYSQIRPKGSSFTHGVGKAPGPDGLRNAHEKIISLLDQCINNGQKKLRPIDAYDLIMHCSDAVLSGGVRRSATICLFSPDDEDMMNAKTGNWFRENPQRGRSNNSAILLRHSTSKEEFKKLMERTKQFGEPGFFWVDDLEALTNPCVEVNLYGYDNYGNSGWQMCNLCEINGKDISSIEEFLEISKAAAIIGTVQAAYTDFPYLGETTEYIVEREALLGVSITGMMDSSEIIFNPEYQKEAAKLIKKTNEEIAAKIGINPAARTTCIKPAGTTSCILGTSSGIHPHHAKRYFRRIQANKSENPLQFFKEINPRAVEESVWSPNNTDDVITFCLEALDKAKTKNQIDALALLEYVKLTQANWVHYGKNYARCVKPWLSHSVSNTINVKPNEWGKVTDFIYDNRKYFAGISFLSSDGDKDYKQAPFCIVHTAKEITAMYGDGSLFASGLIEQALESFEDLWDASDAALDIIRVRPGKAKAKWVKKAKQFANRYFDGDIKKMTYCLKDVYNWKLWTDLNREYKEVDYTEMTEEEDNTKISETISCGGGLCEINI